MSKETIQYTSGAGLTVTDAGQFGINNSNPQYAFDVSGVLNLNTGGGINNYGSYINPPLILTGSMSGIVGGYSYVVGSGAGVSTGLFPQVVIGQELSITSKGGGLAVSGVTTGIVFFNTGTLTSGFTIPSGTIRFFFGDGVHWNVQ